MNRETFNGLRARLQKECGEILLGKGKSYAGNVDVLSNFKRLGKTLGLAPDIVLYIYMMKHLDAITSYIVNRVESSEGVFENIKDVRNYLDLLYALIVERKAERKDEESL